MVSINVCLFVLWIEVGSALNRFQAGIHLNGNISIVKLIAMRFNAWIEGDR